MRTLLIILTLVSFGCSSKSKNPDGGSPQAMGQCTAKLSSGLATGLISPFSNSKVRVAQKLRGDEDWILILDNECASRQSFGLAREVHDQMAYPDMQRQAYRIEAHRATSAALESDPCILGASLETSVRSFALPEPDLSLQNADSIAPAATEDPMSRQQQHLSQVGFFANLEKIRSLTLAANQPVIAIIDTGVDYTHEDLKDTMWTSPQGHYGRDLVQNDDDPRDAHGHGTHVAGLAAATSENGIGGSGIARAKIMAVRVLDASGSTTIDVVANGILWAADNGADVINMSLGGVVSNYSPVLLEALNYAVARQIFIVVAAGNDGRELTDSFRVEPAGHAKNISGMVAVGSLDTSTSRLSRFSNFSPTYVEILAPGSVDSQASPMVGLLSSIPGSTKYTRQSGTSMASPVVAGAAALIIANYRRAQQNYSAAQIETDLKQIGRAETNLNNSATEGKVLDLNLLTLLPVPPTNNNSPIASCRL